MRQAGQVQDRPLRNSARYAESAPKAANRDGSQACVALPLERERGFYYPPLAAKRVSGSPRGRQKTMNGYFSRLAKQSGLRFTATMGGARNVVKPPSPLHPRLGIEETMFAPPAPPETVSIPPRRK